MSTNYTFIKGSSPIVFAAIHHGHGVRDDLKPYLNITDDDRFREEDPYTGQWLKFSDNRIIVHHSRFETDVNRPREKAIYMTPEDAWGLKVWKNTLPKEVINASLKVYLEFYKTAKIYFDELFAINPKIVVYDLHTYNYKREGVDKPADPAKNPDVNIGTKNMERDYWNPVIQALTDHISAFDYNGYKLDVRENIKFKGGYFGTWLHEQYGQNICPISIEFKKFFMDEHTGAAFEKQLKFIGELLASSKEPVLKALKKM